GEMLRQSERMTRILRDLIELTRLETAESGAPHEFVDVVGMLKEIKTQLESHGGGPAVDLALETDAALLGSESELHSIFFNLANNAVRFTPATGKARIA